MIYHDLPDILLCHLQARLFIEELGGLLTRVDDQICAVRIKHLTVLEEHHLKHFTVEVGHFFILRQLIVRHDGRAGLLLLIELLEGKVSPADDEVILIGLLNAVFVALLPEGITCHFVNRVGLVERDQVWMIWVCRELSAEAQEAIRELLFIVDVYPVTHYG